MKRGKIALELYDKGLISSYTLLKECGIDPSYEEELLRFEKICSETEKAIKNEERRKCRIT